MKICSTNKKYLATNDDKPLFLVGSYDMAPIILGNGLWGPLLDAMKGKANYLRIVTLSQDGDSTCKFTTYPRVPNSGKTASGYDGKFNLDIFNNTFFNQLNQFLTKAKKCGIYVHLSLFNEIFVKNKPGCGFKHHHFGNGNHINSSEIGNVDRNNDGDGTDSDEFYDVDALKGKVVISQRKAVADLQKVYVDKIITIANKYDNVFFEIGNEVLAKEWVQYWVKYISNKTDIPITVPSESYQGELPGVDGVCYHRIRYDYGTNYNIAVGLDSDGDANAYDQKDPEVQRKGAWKTFITGHSILGNYAENIIRKKVGDDIVYSNDPRLTQQFKYFGNLLKFLDTTKFRFNVAKPRNDLAGGAYCLAKPGKQYTVYLENGTSCKITLTGYNYPFKVRWFNSKTGLFSPTTLINGGSVQTFNAPSGFDVLFLKKKY